VTKPSPGDGRLPDDGIPTLSNDNFEAEARGMECPPFVRIRYRTGRELLYDLRSWGARRRWRKGKRPHFASLVDKDGGDRDPDRTPLTGPLSTRVPR
jgi:hypothetical protein